jgi:pimeloyl-ACP methyl ester carboxylesterase
MRRFFYSGDLRKASGTKLEKILRKVVVYDQTEQLKKIKAPTLLIWGENDENVPLRIAREMNSLIKNSDLKIIENAGHNSYFDSPNLFYGYIANFISNIK